MEDDLHIEQPVNTQERYLHAIAIRLDALCHMMSSFLEVYAKQNQVAVQENKVEEKPAPKPRTSRKRG